MTPSPAEILILLAAFVFTALVFALLDPIPVVTWCRRLRAWVREECRLIAAQSWADGLYQGRCTGSDPRVAEVAERQRALAKRMRKQGRALLGPARNRKPWVSGPYVLTQPSATRPDNVVPLRTTKGGKP